MPTEDNYFPCCPHCYTHHSPEGCMPPNEHTIPCNEKSFDKGNVTCQTRLDVIKRDTGK